MGKTLDESVGDLMAALGTSARKGQRPASFAVGKVLSGTEQGLRAQCGGTLLTAADICCTHLPPAHYDYLDFTYGFPLAAGTRPWPTKSTRTMMVTT